MKPTESNFLKIKSTTIDKWKDLSGHQKKAFWDLHKQYPEKHLLDHIEIFFNLDDDSVKNDIKRTNSNRVKTYIIKNGIRNEEENISLKEKVKQIEYDSMEKNKQIDKLKKEKKQLNLILSELKSKVTDIEKESAKSGRDLLLHQIECVKNNNELNSEIKKLKDQVKEITMKIKQLEYKVEDLESKLKDRDLNIEKMKHQIETLRTEYEEKIQRLQDDYRNLQICHERQVQLNANNK